MKTLITHAMVALLGITTSVYGQSTLEPVGVIGNTGEQGRALLQQTADMNYRGHGNSVGCGLAIDSQGTLWTRLDDAFVTRLSLDGRQLARFAAPPSSHGYDTLVIASDQVLLIASGELYALPVSAPAGSAFKSLGVKLRAIAHTPFNDRLAAITDDSKLVWVNPNNGSCHTIADIPNAWLVESNAKGELFVGTRISTSQMGVMRKLIEGKEVTDKNWPKAWDLVIPGIAISPDVLVSDGDGFFLGGNGYVSHLDADLNPAPGTVLGMQGRTVIGIGADWRPELGSARGIARVRDGLYAVGGSRGQPFFASWPDRTRSMNLISWFTAQPDCKALAINAQGDVFVDRLQYAWNATPDAFPSLGQGAMSTAGQIARYGDRLMIRLDRWAHGNESWALPLYSGEQLQNTDFLNGEKLDGNIWWKRASQGNGQEVFPSVVYAHGPMLTLLALADTSGAYSLSLHRNGRFESAGQRVAFKLAQPGKVLTSLAMKDEHTLLAAIDGQVIELTANGNDWQEKRRWNSWGSEPENHFGDSIFIAFDDDRLLVSDSQRQRVLLFAADGGKPLAQVGSTDAPGHNLTSLSAPGLITLCGKRAVVHDAGNQRLIKLEMEP